MKKFSIFAAIAALVSISSNAASFIGLDADSIRINPNRLTGYWQVPVVANFEGYADTWQVSVTYPGGVIPKLVAGITALDGMTVGYTDPTGAMQNYEAPLQVSAMYETLSSTTAGNYGYWDYNMDGIYETYGNIKWEPGKHQMWEYNIYIPGDFRAGYIVFDGTINSGYDARGAILSNVKSYKRTWLWVGYERGDVGGDGRIDIVDVTLLIDRILGKITFDEFQEKAADINRDWVIDIDDVTALNDMILKN
jgi:hypothetical protein